MHQDEQRLDLSEERSDREAYEAPAATDIGPAERHTHGPSTRSADSPANTGMQDDK